MGYETRCTGRRQRHDPAYGGVFIHRNGRPNAFRVSLPLPPHVRRCWNGRTWEEVVGEDPIHRELPTFHSALRAARAFLDRHGLELPVYACTDRARRKHDAGFRYLVQRVL